jgi:hypothetical protein
MHDVDEEFEWLGARKLKKRRGARQRYLGHLLLPWRPLL